MQALLMPMGSQGDVQPYIGMGLELQRRGHAVLIAANVYFEALVRTHGLDFVGLKSSPDLEAFFKQPDLCNPKRAWQAAGRWGTLAPMREIYQIIADRYVPGETVVAAPYGAFGARLAQERLGVPLATVLLLPNELRSLYRTPVLPKPLVLHDWVPRFLKRLQFWIMDRFFVDPLVGPETNAFRAELGLPPVRGFLAHWCFSPDRVIGCFPEWYAPYQPDWPCQTRLTGFPRWDPPISRAEHRDAMEFLEAGEPVIVFTAGSYNRHGQAFFQAAVESCVALGRRGVLLTKYRDQLPERLPAEVRHFDFVPLAAVLPHAAALVSHGGIGTVAQALVAGVPQVLMPIAFNQPDEAVRLKRLGVANFIPPERFRGRRLTHVLKQLLASAQVRQRCRELTERFHAVDSVQETCDLVQELQGLDLRR